jgi:hypothetical protein
MLVTGIGVEEMFKRVRVAVQRQTSGQQVPWESSSLVGDPSYFTATPSSQDQVGEMLTIIVTKSPLDLPISDKPLEISAGEMGKWEKM